MISVLGGAGPGFFGETGVPGIRGRPGGRQFRSNFYL